MQAIQRQRSRRVQVEQSLASKGMSGARKSRILKPSKGQSTETISRQFYDGWNSWKLTRQSGNEHRESHTLNTHGGGETI